MSVHRAPLGASSLHRWSPTLRTTIANMCNACLLWGLRFRRKISFVGVECSLPTGITCRYRCSMHYSNSAKACVLAGYCFRMSSGSTAIKFETAFVNDNSVTVDLRGCWCKTLCSVALVRLHLFGCALLLPTVEHFMPSGTCNSPCTLFTNDWHPFVLRCQP